MTRRITPFVAVATALVLLSAGCSDDIICPEPGPADTAPYISAQVVQSSDGPDESTHAEVVCTADPLPSSLIAFINGRELPPVVPPDGLGLLAVLDDDTVLWQPGTWCLLEVAMEDYGHATATVVMPAAAAVTARSAGDASSGLIARSAIRVMAPMTSARSGCVSTMPGRRSPSVASLTGSMRRRRCSRRARSKLRG